jgi:uncharacterized protein (DUF4213/DUF364 family)
LVASHEHSTEPDVPQAGQLHTLSARELASMATSSQPTRASIGVAALNALIAPQTERWRDVNAEDVIAERGAGKTVALIGSFPFIKRLRGRVGTLHVLERNPGNGELPADAAPEILPQADVIAITSMTLANHTLDELLSLRNPAATVLLLGPSTPLTPVLFEHGIDLLSGSFVADLDSVLKAIKQGANFRQVHRAGVRLVTMKREE